MRLTKVPVWLRANPSAFHFLWVTKFENWIDEPINVCVWFDRKSLNIYLLVFLHALFFLSRYDTLAVHIRLHLLLSANTEQLKEAKSPCMNESILNHFILSIINPKSYSFYLGWSVACVQKDVPFRAKDGRNKEDLLP